eukprot:TRINITY_DN1123_c0_g5_i1.p1 TRINITY_DN1123_c0_g5~~TRINITY_DN1123_c0_g5_i1.p1  ORF type:complete len:357 (-),score=103.83 TRINITY_DN1123_c0_g5_i1:302-1372(-)
MILNKIATTEFAVALSVVAFACLFAWKYLVVEKERKKIIIEENEKREKPSIEEQQSNFSTIHWEEEQVKLPRKEVIVETFLGPVTVTLVGEDNAKGKIVTLHEIGTNHRSSYGSFTQLASSVKEFKNVQWVHIDLPGHREGDATVERMGSMSELVEMVGGIVDHFNISYFIAFGIGIGANIWLRYSLRSHDKLMGMILIGVTPESAAIGERVHLGLASASLRFGMNSYSQRALSRFLFNQDLDSHSVKSCCSTMRDLNPVNVKALVDVYRTRDSIATESLSLNNVPVLLFAGTSGPFGYLIPGVGRVTAMLELFQKLNMQVSSWSEHRFNGHLLTEEAPKDLLECICVFLKALRLA